MESYLRDCAEVVVVECKRDPSMSPVNAGFGRRTFLELLVWPGSLNQCSVLAQFRFIAMQPANREILDAGRHDTFSELLGAHPAEQTKIMLVSFVVPNHELIEGLGVPGAFRTRLNDLAMITRIYRELRRRHAQRTAKAGPPASSTSPSSWIDDAAEQSLWTRLDELLLRASDAVVTRWTDSSETYVISKLAELSGNDVVTFAACGIKRLAAVDAALDLPVHGMILRRGMHNGQIRTPGPVAQSVACMSAALAKRLRFRHRTGVFHTPAPLAGFGAAGNDKNRELGDRVPGWFWHLDAEGHEHVRRVAAAANAAQRGADCFSRSQKTPGAGLTPEQTGEWTVKGDCPEQPRLRRAIRSARMRAEKSKMPAAASMTKEVFLKATTCPTCGWFLRNTPAYALKNARLSLRNTCHGADSNNAILVR
jgi:hypothetical protein